LCYELTVLLRERLCKKATVCHIEVSNK